jgi:hypothetical protein
MATTEPLDPPRARGARLSIAAVWLAAVIGSVLVTVFAESGQALVWFPIVLAGATIFAFTLQLLIDRKEGLVERLMASLGGAVVIIAAATAVVLFAGVG